ncbi:3-oxoacyl-[acyl-carrier-protein] synthase III [Paraburkholderia silvatlantica]|nr:3-oxoacyl-[acyl-carrier-protein] synthase III [Paraburkholderia silvatlantica]
MSSSTDPVRQRPYIVATARYIPPMCVRSDAELRPPATAPSSAREAVMRSVYADTLRWSREPGPGPGPNNHSPQRVPAATAAHVACEPALLLSEMASTVAREAIRRGPGKGNSTLDQVIVCATSFEHDLALSCAGRLHSELGAAGMPFAIGQLQGVSFFLALQIVSDMMASDECMRTALIVGAERWRPPFSRLAGSPAALGDGAAAVVVRQHAGPGWHVLNVNVHTPCLLIAPPDMYVDEMVVVEVIGQTCARAGFKPGAIDWIVPPRIDAALASRISAQARLSGRMWYPEHDDTGYLCAADAPAQFDALLQEIVPSEGQCILLWSVGLQGQAACAILEYRGD